MTPAELLAHPLAHRAFTDGTRNLLEWWVQRGTPLLGAEETRRGQLEAHLQVYANAAPPDPAGRRLKTTEAVNVTEKPIVWTWRHRLLRGAVNLLEGEPEAGKSSIMYDLLARLSRGDDLPDGAACEPHRVLIVGAEDALECVVLPRLKAADANLGNIRFATGAFDPDLNHSQRIVLPDDLPLLAIAGGDRDILFVDSSINDLAERTIRPGDDIRMRELLGALGDLAQQLNITVIATRHARKGGSRNPLEYGSGTMGVAAKARVILAVLRDPKDRATRLFARSKCNVAPKVATLRCVFAPSNSLVPDSPLVVSWHGEDPRDTHEILADIAASYAGRKDDSSKARRALAEWLRDGEWKTVQALRGLCAAASELTWKAIEKARVEMAIDSERRAGVGQCWRDPYAGTRTDDTQRE
jgi:hypothetical protein